MSLCRIRTFVHVCWNRRPGGQASLHHPRHKALATLARCAAPAHKPHTQPDRTPLTLRFAPRALCTSTYKEGPLKCVCVCARARTRPETANSPFARNVASGSPAPLASIRRSSLGNTPPSRNHCTQHSTQHDTHLCQEFTVALPFR